MTALKAATLFGVSMMVTACSNAGGSGDFSSAALDTGDQKASYGVGLNVGSQLRDARESLDRAAFMRGIEDAFAAAEPAVPQEELEAALQAFGQQIQTAAAQERARVGTENAEAGADFRSDNAERDGVTTTESGLQYEVLRAGDGAMPTRDDVVRLHYRGTLIDGTEFDSSYGGDPAEFPVGGLIAGFTEALLLMQEGSHFRIVIPSEIAYGPAGSGPQIGPNSTLVFEIELLEVLQ
jgi:FKBP-type peptidyl-prolyl cis-trans isomerase